MKSKRLLFAAVAAGIFSISVFGQETAKESQNTPTNFDAALAKKLGADKYGMRNYVLVFLKTGPAKIDDKAEIGKLFAGHLSNIRRLAAEGKLALAGPFNNDPDYRGMFIFAVETVDDAKKLTATDPAIKAGLLAAEYHLWWGSAALMEVNGIHGKIAQESP